MPVKKETALLTVEQKKLLLKDFPKSALSDDKSRGFTLTSIKAAYVMERLNDVFGICGSGWKYTISKLSTSETKVNGGFKVEIGCLVSLQYKMSDGEWSEKIKQFGGKQIVKGNVTDARKSAVTDGLTKVASILGIGHKVFKGEANDPNYGKLTPATQQTGASLPPQQTASAPAPNNDPVKMITPPQATKINELLKQKNQDVSKILDFYKKTDLNELTMQQASGVIGRLIKLETPTVDNNVDDPKPEGTSNGGVQFSDKMASKGDEILFMNALNKRAEQVGDTPIAMLAKFKEKVKVKELTGLTHDQIRQFTDKIIEMNSDHIKQGGENMVKEAEDVFGAKAT